MVLRLYPSLVNDIVLPTYDIVRRTSRFRCSRVLSRTQWLSRKEIDALQLRNLRFLLRHAYEDVPYYHRMFKERGFIPDEITSIDDLVRLPVLTKADVRKNSNDLISRSFPRTRLILYQTGGTGNPLNFYITKDSLSWEVAAEYRAYGWAGYHLGDRCFTFWASPLDTTRSRKISSSFARALERVIIVNPFVLSDRILENYATLLRKFNPEIIRGYSNCIYLMARYLVENDIHCVSPRAVITAAETLPDFKRKLIEQAFGCQVFDYYGSREVGAIAAECDEHSGYHISAENVVVEFVKEGEQIAEGKSGLLVITNLRNFGMPFIRYRIEDVAVASDELCACGRKLPLISSVLGRVTEFMSVRDVETGKIVPVNSNIFVVPLMHLPVKHYRVVQENLDTIIIKVVKGAGYTQEHTSALMKEVYKGLGNNVKVEIEFVDRVEPLPSGKRQDFISKIDSFQA